MADVSKLKDLGVGGMVGVVAMGLLQLNIFATKTDLADLQVTVARDYITRAEVITGLERLENKLDAVITRLEGKRP
jgi:hypothetical protein